MNGLIESIDGDGDVVHGPIVMGIVVQGVTGQDVPGLDQRLHGCPGLGEKISVGMELGAHLTGTVRPRSCGWSSKPL